MTLSGMFPKNSYSDVVLTASLLARAKHEKSNKYLLTFRKGAAQRP